MSRSQVPVALSIAGHDPSGGAGVQADIEAMVSMGCHATTVVTCLAIQDTCQVHRLVPMDTAAVVEQARAVLEDMPVAAIKIGVLASVDTVRAVYSILADYPRIPVVLDPVLAAGGDDTPLADDGTLAALRTLLSRVTVLTPNGPEARRLAPEADTLDACATALLEYGCGHVLITGGHQPGEQVINRLYGHHRLIESYRWQRLAPNYHGSGCTLSAAIAGLLAQGCDVAGAVRQAQQYTWSSLQQGIAVGRGQQLPNRLFWARGESR